MDERTRPQQIKNLKRPKSRASWIFIFFWLAIMGLTFARVVNQSSRYNDLRAELTRLEADIEVRTVQNEDLQMQIDFFDSDAYIEQLARDRLGMVRPNEIVFRNIAHGE